MSLDVVAFFYFSKFFGIFSRSFSSSRGRLGVLGATLHLLRPIAHVLVGVEDKVRWTRHVMLPLTFAHVVSGAVLFVWMVAYVAVFFFAGDLVG